MSLENIFLLELFDDFRIKYHFSFFLVFCQSEVCLVLITKK